MLHVTANKNKLKGLLARFESSEFSARLEKQRNDPSAEILEA
jgi:hypothetical protein